MPQGPGEDLLLTVFADVHYFLGSQQEKPPHHRFDKGSYVYLYKNAAQNRGRVEVANNAGTPEQDAFSGYIDSTHTQYSHKHPTLVSVTVDGASLAGGAPSTTANDPSQWHLPSYDPRNEKKYMYRLRTIDLYFWTVEDAALFLHSVGDILPPSQLRVLDAPAPPSAHVDAISPVVQKLESAAITDPSYAHQRGSGGITGAASKTTTVQTPATLELKEEPADYAPLTYNPAAPAAPETIAHREKTPPPPEGAQGTGLAAVANESSAGPGITPGIKHQPSFPIAPPSAIPSAIRQGSVGPAAQSASQKPLSFSPDEVPDGGYSDYQYQPVAALKPQKETYSIHNQVYRPTESEMAAKKPVVVDGKIQEGKLDKYGKGVDKTVGGFLKKLEKRIG